MIVDVCKLLQKLIDNRLIIDYSLECPPLDYKGLIEVYKQGLNCTPKCNKPCNDCNKG